MNARGAGLWLASCHVYESDPSMISGTRTVDTTRTVPIFSALLLTLALILSACGPSDSDSDSDRLSDAFAPTATASEAGGSGTDNSASAPTAADTPAAISTDQDQTTNDQSEATAESAATDAEERPVVLPTPRAIDRTPAPIRLRVPKIGIDTTVQWVGEDAEGQMMVPSNYGDVAWYELGPPPGTPGNAVVAGHLDSTTGPAVFFRLRELQPGDEIFIGNEAGQELRFVVADSELYDADNAPLDRIFGPAIKPRLNLVTCDGAFDQSARQYDKRLVVFTELAEG